MGNGDGASRADFMGWGGERRGREEGDDDTSLYVAVQHWHHRPAEPCTPAQTPRAHTHTCSSSSGPSLTSLPPSVCPVPRCLCIFGNAVLPFPSEFLLAVRCNPPSPAGKAVPGRGGGNWWALQTPHLAEVVCVCVNVCVCVYMLCTDQPHASLVHS